MGGLRLWLAVCMGAWALPQTGCVKLKTQVLVMPNRSGKIVLTFSVNERTLADALSKTAPLLKRSGGRTPTASDISASAINVGGIERASEGLVAFSRPQERVAGGWKTITLTGYFDDINRVRIRKERNGEVMLDFTFSANSEGYVLEVLNRSLQELTTESLLNSFRGTTGQDVPPQVMTLLAPMLDGFGVTEAYKLPGVVREVEGLPRKEGRLAGMTLGKQFLLNPAKANELAAVTRRTIMCGPTRVTRSEDGQFRGELAQAKQDWRQRKSGQK